MIEITAKELLKVVKMAKKLPASRFYTLVAALGAPLLLFAVAAVLSGVAALIRVIG